MQIKRTSMSLLLLAIEPDATSIDTPRARGLVGGLGRRLVRGATEAAARDVAANAQRH